MRKNIVLCSDGTGNAEGKEHGTNVWRLFLAVERRCEREQIAFYDGGAGISGGRVSILGKVFGVGLSRNLRQLYTALVRCFEEGDRIYLFGFGRGAFTVRSLAGMISEVGVLARQRENGERLGEEALEEAALAAYKGYRAQLGFGGPEAFRQWCADRGLRLHRPRIHFLGVWDTVDASGAPLAELRPLVQKLTFARRPHLHDLNRDTVHVRHALAIDEGRRSFEPVIFDERRRQEGWALESIAQVWFAGAHGNVGGGCPRKGLESISLAWMLREAEAAGLEIDAAELALAERRANAHSKLYDPRRGLGRFSRYRMRDLETLSRERGGTEVTVHVSVLERARPGTEGYAPSNLGASFRVAAATDPARDDPRTRRAIESLSGRVGGAAAGTRNRRLG